jgi:signal transduction histidine kinase
MTIPSTEHPLQFTYRDKISFEFIGINFIDPAKTQYAYLLENYDDAWNYSGNVSTASYAGLQAGNYVLRIKATNRAGFWEVPETIMNIHVTGPLWKTWWFIASCMVLSLLVLFALYYYRLIHIQKIHAIRNKISKDLHDDIGSTLSSISISSTVAEKMSKEQFPEIISTMSYIGKNSREALENMSDIVWAINPANESLKKLIDRIQIYAYAILAAKNIRLHLDFPESIYSTKLTMQQRKNIYLILREAIQNVAKYSEATTCLVTGNLVNKKINIQVKDDGLGFDEIMTSLGGNGMFNMRQRADELKATFAIQSEKLKGTSLTLELN